MGTLNEVYQLKSFVLSASAVLKVRKEKEHAFMKAFDITEVGPNITGLFSDTFVSKSTDGKVERMAIYAAERFLPVRDGDIYLSIQSDGKWGFNDAFTNGIERAAPFLEDALFFVIYDIRITRFTIENGILSIDETTNFDEWDHQFDQYVLSHYMDFPVIITEYFLDEVVELKMHLEELAAEGGNPRSFYEWEDFEEFLNKLISYRSYLPMEKVEPMEAWLREQIVLQKAWDDAYYGNE